MSEYKDMFVEEAREHLQTLNQTLVDFEENPKDKDAMNQIFRAAHTLKGMAAAMNYTEIQKLAHKTEDTLDLVRNNQLEVNTGFVDLIFKCFDGLEIMVEEISDKDATSFNIAEIIQNLEKFLGQSEKKNQSNKEIKKPKKNQQKPSLSIDEKTKAKIVKEIDSGRDIYKLDIEVDKTCLMKSIRAFLLLKKLNDIGDIVYAKPNQKMIEDGEFDAGFELIISTQDDMDYVQRQINTVSELSKKNVIQINFENEKLTIGETREENLQLEIDEEKIDRSLSDNIENKEEKQSINSVEKRSQSIRVDMDQLDDFMNLIGELVISKGRLGQIALDHNIDELSETINTFDRLTTELQDKIMNIRMIPMGHIFNRFPRMIRDLAKSSNKKINLIIEGEGIELDRTILDEIGDPLVHLLRNSVDHGIETPSERKKGGKPEEGNIYLIAERKRNHIFITVKDDGKGIDPNEMRKNAIKKGLRTKEEAELLNDQQALDLLWLPGLSSKEEITSVSGRGVGMDVVKSTLEKLNGIVEYTSVINEGSTFSLKLPLTMAIFKSLFVGIDTETYAIPISNIIETVRLTKNDIRKINGVNTTVIRNQVLPLKSLKHILGLRNKTHENLENMFAVVIQKEDKQFGLIVDQLIGEQEITIKNMKGSIKRSKGIAGFTITGDGRVIPVLDLNNLLDKKNMD
ncbi:chemotaxis protein CheA [Thermoplasmatales archaeon ex4572_165]|nr:MAG: chemotaxis protein CheA [Thermoplasmatales archaeon ex4572_165]